MHFCLLLDTDRFVTTRLKCFGLSGSIGVRPTQKSWPLRKALGKNYHCDTFVRRNMRYPNLTYFTSDICCRLIEVNARFHAQHFYPLCRACLGYDALTATMDSYFDSGRKSLHIQVLATALASTTMIFWIPCHLYHSYEIYLQRFSILSRTGPRQCCRMDS